MASDRRDIERGTTAGNSGNSNMNKPRGQQQLCHTRDSTTSIITDGGGSSFSSNLNWMKRYCYLGFRDCFQFHRPPHLKEKPIDYTSFIQVFIAKLLLEVCGAAGAIWGCSEILLLRTIDNNSTWRIVSLVIFGIFLVRFWWHSKHYLEHDREFPPIKIKHRRYHKLSFCQIFSAKLVLEVWGAAGAIWGPSDALKLRTATQSNTESWRIVSIWVLSLFTIRWVLQIMTYCLCFQQRQMDHLPTINKCIGWFEMIMIRFVLVVLGAIGAVWGFSEILLLRTNTPESNQFWRPIALATGLVFTFRWLLQIFEFALGLWDDPPPPDDSIRNSSRRSSSSKLSLVARLGINKNGDLESSSSDLQLTETPVLTPPMIVEDES